MLFIATISSINSFIIQDYNFGQDPFEPPSYSINNIVVNFFGDNLKTNENCLNAPEESKTLPLPSLETVLPGIQKSLEEENRVKEEYKRETGLRSLIPGLKKTRMTRQSDFKPRGSDFYEIKTVPGMKESSEAAEVNASRRIKRQAPGGGNTQMVMGTFQALMRPMTLGGGSNPLQSQSVDIVEESVE